MEYQLTIFGWVLKPLEKMTLLIGGLERNLPEEILENKQGVALNNSSGVI